MQNFSHCSELGLRFQSPLSSTEMDRNRDQNLWIYINYKDKPIKVCSSNRCGPATSLLLRSVENRFWLHELVTRPVLVLCEQCPTDLWTTVKLSPRPWWQSAAICETKVVLSTPSTSLCSGVSTIQNTAWVHLRSIHTVWKRKRKRKFAAMSLW